MQQTQFSFLKAQQIKEIIDADFDVIYEIIKKAYRDYHQGYVNDTNSLYLYFPDEPGSRIIGLPVVTNKDEKIVGLKWISSCINNHQLSLPRASGLIILNDPQTKFPFACLDAAYISLIRTAFSAALAAELLHGKNKYDYQLGIIGAGLLGKTIFKTLLCLDWKIDKIAIYDVNEEIANNFLSSIDNEYLNTPTIASNLNSLIKNSDLISFTTNMLTPHVFSPRLFAHSPTVLHISLRDLAPIIINHSFNVVDDSRHVLTNNTSLHLLYKELKNDSFIAGNIVELMDGNICVDEDSTRIFSPMGLGILDMQLAAYVYAKAKSQKTLISIDDFFNSKY